MNCEPSTAKTQQKPAEEEAESAHLLVSLKMVLICFGCVTLAANLIAIYISAHHHYIEIDTNPNLTDFIRNNYQFYENGNGSIYVINENMEQRWISDNFIPYYVDRMSMFQFGFGNSSFCNSRNISSEKYWSTSIFRSSQLFSSVQTLARFGVLISMTPFLLASYIIARNFILEKYTFLSVLTGISYVINEFLLYCAYFLFTAIHVSKDQKYIPYSIIFFEFSAIFTVLKFGLRSIIDGMCIATMFRIFSTFFFISTYPILAEDILDYANNVYCDNFAPNIVANTQLLFIFLIFANNLYDILQSSSIFLVVASTMDEKDVNEKYGNSIFIQKM